MTKDEALKLALEALERGETELRWQAITAIKEALAQPEQCQCSNCRVTLHASDCAVHNEPAYPAGGCDCGAQQGPVAWMWRFESDEGAAFSTQKPTISIRDGVNYVPLYTTPPQRKPLTGEQEREAFEAWALGTICYKEDLQRKEITGYGSQELNYLWRGWSAKAAHGIKE